jgi:hypothetical protein
MSVSAAEIAEWKAAYQAQPPGEVDNTLETFAEVIGFLIHRLRAIGADQDELAHDIELLVRVAELDAASIRECRDVLVRLAYPRDLTTLMTRLARKARPRSRRNH